MATQESIGKWISTLYRQIQIHLNKELEPYNIGSGQIQVLKVLYKNEKINQESISKLLYYDKATIGRAITKLIKEGYVTRERNPNDRRAYILHITPSGRSLEPVVNSILERVTSILLSDLNKEEQEIAFELMKKMHKNILVKDEE